MLKRNIIGENTEFEPRYYSGASILTGKHVSWTVKVFNIFLRFDGRPRNRDYPLPHWKKDEKKGNRNY